jgi:hypothetical protein
VFKRRITIFGATALLALAGLTGAAAADGGPGPAQPDGSPGLAGTVVCTTSDGRTFTLAEGKGDLPGPLARPGHLAGPEHVTGRHDAPPAGTKAKGSTSAGQPPIMTYHVDGEDGPATAGAVPAKRLERGETVHLERAEAGRARPAKRLDGDEDVTKALTIDCKMN